MWDLFFVFFFKLCRTVAPLFRFKAVFVSTGRLSSVGFPPRHHDDGLSIDDNTPLVPPSSNHLLFFSSGVPGNGGFARCFVPLRPLHADHTTADPRPEVTRLQSLRLGLPAGTTGEGGQKRQKLFSPQKWLYFWKDGFLGFFWTRSLVRFMGLHNCSVSSVYMLMYLTF